MKEKNILIFFGDYFLRSELAIILKTTASIIYETGRASQVKEIIRNERPDLVIFNSVADDGKVSDETKELTGFIKKQNPQPKTLVFYGAANEREEARKLGDDTYFKLSSTDELIQKVEWLLEERR